MTNVSSRSAAEFTTTGKILVALAVAVGAWQILSAADPGKAALQVLLAAGFAVLVAALLFAGALGRVMRPALYATLVIVLAVWLVLAWGATQWSWNLLPG
jgi:hypothetical protein